MDCTLEQLADTAGCTEQDNFAFGSFASDQTLEAANLVGAAVQHMVYLDARRLYVGYWPRNNDLVQMR